MFQVPDSQDGDVVKWAHRVTKIRIIDGTKWKGVGECFRGLWKTLTSAEQADSPYLEQIRVALRGNDDSDDNVTVSWSLSVVHVL